jgi:hypothetical protein
MVIFVHWMSCIVNFDSHVPKLARAAMNQAIGGFNVQYIDGKLNIQSLEGHCAKLVVQNVFDCMLFRCKRVVVQQPLSKSDDVKCYVWVDLSQKVTTKQTDSYKTSASGDLTVTNYNSYSKLSRAVDGTRDPGTLMVLNGRKWQASLKSSKASKVNYFMFYGRMILIVGMFLCLGDKDQPREALME